MYMPTVFPGYCNGVAVYRTLQSLVLKCIRAVNRRDNSPLISFRSNGHRCYAILVVSQHPSRIEGNLASQFMACMDKKIYILPGLQMIRPVVFLNEWFQILEEIPKLPGDRGWKNFANFGIIGNLMLYSQVYMVDVTWLSN